MHRIVLLDISLVDDASYTNAQKLLSPDELIRYKHFRHTSDARLFLFGRYLTKQLIASYTGQTPEAIKIIVDGIAEKPYELHRTVEFSISHSGNYVAVAISPSPIGIDVQIHDQQDLTLFDTFFKDDEQKYAHQSSHHFYQLWTAIESLAKITGLGFNESLAKRVVTINEAVKGFTLGDTHYFIHEQIVNAHSTLSIATVEPIVFTQEPVSDLPGLHQAIIYSASGSIESAV